MSYISISYLKITLLNKSNDAKCVFELEKMGVWQLCKMRKKYIYVQRSTQSSDNWKRMNGQNYKYSECKLIIITM